VSEVLEKCGDRISVLSGDDFTVLPLLCLGGRGVISVVSNVAPADMAGMVRAFNDGDLAGARELHFRLMPLARAMFLETNPVPVKTALALMGRIALEVRLPLYEMTPENRVRLEGVLRSYGLLEGA